MAKEESDRRHFVMREAIANYERRIITGEMLMRDEVLTLVDAPLEQLTYAADRIRRARCGNGFDICSILNVKSGRCPEDCAYCAQSVHGHADIACYPLLESDTIVASAVRDRESGVLRFSLVASGKRLDHSEIERCAQAIAQVKKSTDVAVCASLGLLSQDEFALLAEAGLERVHNNLETSRAFFPLICTTHTYDEKIRAIKHAQAAGLSVCSGGIIGLGESWEDRIDLALELRKLDVRSVPVNVLNPLTGTRLGNITPLSDNEVLRTVALLRFALPDVALRLAGGRALLSDAGRTCFRAGANAAISGDMLTTAGFTIASDRAMAAEEGFVVKPDNA